MQEDPPLDAPGAGRGTALVAGPVCRRRWAGPLALVLLVALPPGPATAGEMVTNDAYKVKAAFLRHFAHYVTWPPQTFLDKDAPWCIGILGTDPFGATLERTLIGRSEQGRSFTVHRAKTVAELPPCQIVYITHSTAEQRLEALGHFKGKPVLTVGEAPEFLKEGGVVLLQVDGRIRMSINLDQARAASLEVHTTMLEVSSAVLENGRLQRVR